MIHENESSKHPNIALMERWFEQVWNERQFEIIDEIDLYTLRKQIVEDPHMFNFVTDMVNLLGETKVEANSNLKYKSRLEEIKKITNRT